MALPVYTPHASYTNVDYTSSFVTATATERCNVFFPQGHTPGVSSGATCLVYIDNAGFNSGTLITEIAPSDGIPALLYGAISRGVVIVFATVCQSKDVALGGPPGAGTFDPPIASAANWNDVNQPSFAKSAIHLVQWIKENATALGIDEDKIYTAGRSGGAAPAMWVALGPDWTDASISTAGQFRPGISSRVAGCIAFLMHSWWLAHDQDVVPQQYGPDLLDPSNTVADYGEDVSTAIQIRVSPLHYAFTESVYPGIQTLNATARVFLYSPGPVFLNLPAPTIDDFALNSSTGLPTLSDKLTAFHDGWHPVMLANRLRGIDPTWFRRNCRCVFAAESATGTNWGWSHTVTNDLDAYKMMVDWLLQSTGAQPGEPLSEQILKQVVTQLETISEDNGYFHTPAKVARGQSALFSGPYPAITVVPISEEYLQTGEETVQGLTSRMRLTISFLHESEDHSDQWTQQTISDIKESLLTDQQLLGLALDVQLVSIDFLHAEDPSSGLAGADMEWEITYRTPANDYTYPL